MSEPLTPSPPRLAEDTSSNNSSNCSDRSGSRSDADDSNSSEGEEFSFASARAELDIQVEESKFEKHGRNQIKALEHELLAIKGDNKKLKRQTRLEGYQIEAVLAVKNHFQQPRQAGLALVEGEEADILPLKKALIIAPPGSGKSGMVTLIPYVLQSKKVLIITPSKIISEQLAADFGYPDHGTAFLLKAGIYQKAPELRKMLESVHLAITQKDIDHITASNLVIVNAQKFGGRSASSLSSSSGRTLEDREKVERQLQEFDTIIVDEAHHYPAKTWVNIVQIFAGKKVVFLTATPFRGEAHMSELLQRNVETVYKIDSRELEGKTIRRTEFIERTAIAEELDDPEFLSQLRDDIVEILGHHKTQENRADIHQAMILVRTKAETQLVAQGLVALGQRATFVISDKDGNKNLEDFTKAEKMKGEGLENYKDIVVVCGMLREGYDNPNVSLVVILRKCQSRVLFEQFCGRCMRVNRNLTSALRGSLVDRTMGTVLSYKHFKQSEMWAKRLVQSDQDPADDESDGEENGVVNFI